MKKIFALVIILLLIGCSSSPTNTTSMKLTSTAFTDQASLPAQYTCDGEDVSPPLAWSDVPEKTQSFVLIVDDPDTAHGTWNHWLLYDIPADVRKIDEHRSAGIEGTTSMKTVGYHGACPPNGVHRYFFKLFALDTLLHILPAANKVQIEKAMEGHIMGQAELMGKYQRSGK